MWRSGVKYIKSATSGRWLFVAAYILVSACKEKYNPVVNDVNPNYLVVDGFINTGSDSTIFKLSRTFKLESKAIVAPEKGAIVTVENDAGFTYNLPELALKPGTYAAPALNLDQSKKHRLRVRTKDNKEYLSDFVESKVSPPFELTYDFRHGNVNIYSNTQDVTGKSRYYQYSYVESWQYRAIQESLLKIENHQLLPRKRPEDDIFNCYYNIPGKISIASTSALTEDKVEDHLITDVLPNSVKLRIEYGVIVKQYVLTKAGFEFFEALKKNTEQVGSIFDAQPSVLPGNIHAVTNPADVVIGFVSAGTVTEKSIVLLGHRLPFPFYSPGPDTVCSKRLEGFAGDRLQSVLLDPVKSKYIPVFYTETGAVAATQYPECVDCRLQGGTNVLPSYWTYLP